jgi:hypothetical protein
MAITVNFESTSVRAVPCKSCVSLVMVRMKCWMKTRTMVWLRAASHIPLSPSSCISSFCPLSLSRFSSSSPSSGWNIDELNQEIEEICGSFTDPFTSSPTSPPSLLPRDPPQPIAESDPDQSSSSLPEQPMISRRSDGPHEETLQPFNHHFLSSQSLPSRRNLLLITRKPLSSDLILQLTSSSAPADTTILSPQLWDGSLTSLLSLVSSQDYHDGIVLIEAEGHEVDSDCEKILRLVQKSCPVIVVNHSQHQQEQAKRVARLRGVDLREGISLAMFGLRKGHWS